MDRSLTIQTEQRPKVSKADRKANAKKAAVEAEAAAKNVKKGGKKGGSKGDEVKVEGDEGA
jgi:hypothetical protein